jgi:hypothetical protein
VWVCPAVSCQSPWVGYHMYFTMVSHPHALCSTPHIPTTTQLKPLLHSGELLLTFWLTGAAEHGWPRGCVQEPNTQSRNTPLHLTLGVREGGWWSVVTVVSSYAISTHNPPYKQLLIGLGAVIIVIPVVHCYPHCLSSLFLIDYCHCH